MPFRVVVEKQTDGTAKNCVFRFFEDNQLSISEPTAGLVDWGEENEAEKLVFDIGESVRSAKMEVVLYQNVEAGPGNYTLKLSVECDGIVSNKVSIPSAWKPIWDTPGGG